MPLVLKAVGTRSRPVILCDHCGHEITDAREGNYQWRLPETGNCVEGTIYFTHKTCCRAFEAQCTDLTWGSTDLECLLIHLGKDLRVDWEESRENDECEAALLPDGGCA